MGSQSDRSGFIAIAGRPNVGKSTLINALTGEKISIVTAKPQTTRYAVRGILNIPDGQLVFVDTPGLQNRSRHLLDRAMNRSARHAIDQADVVLIVIEAGPLKASDRALLESTNANSCVVAINKIDNIANKEKLLPLIANIAEVLPGADVVPVSAKKRRGLDALVGALIKHLPEGPRLYPENIVTDQDEAFRIAEVIREKLMIALYEEVPYGTAVEIESIEDDDGVCRISAIVWVDRPSLKGIVIGAGGQQLKAVGQAARLELRELLKRPVHLSLWARVRAKWADDPSSLGKLGVDTS